MTPFEEVSKELSETWAQSCRRHVLEVFGEKGQEYIDEAEHQDGEEYWENFSNFTTLDDDVKRYFEA